MMKILITLIILTIFNTCTDNKTVIPMDTLVYEMILKTKSGYIRRKADMIMKYSIRYNLDPITFTKLGIAESSFRHEKINDYTKCVGIFQINMYYWKHLIHRVQGGKYGKRMNARGTTNYTKYFQFIGVNTQAAAIILSTYLKQHDYDYREALIHFSGFNVKRYRNSPVKKRYLKAVLGIDK